MARLSRHPHKVLFEARGHFGVYDANRPDDRAPGNHAKVLLYRGDPVGVIRIDIAENEAIFRRVAIREAVQRVGHGRALLSLAQEFAAAHGCRRLASHVAPDAVPFYEKCGFSIERQPPTASAGHGSVFMTKGIGSYGATATPSSSSAPEKSEARKAGSRLSTDP